MVIKSQWSFDIPKVTLPSFVFESPSAELPTEPTLISAKNPEKHYLSLADYRLWSQRLASGLRRSGVKEGERVLLFSGNTLFFPAVIMGTIMAGCIFTGANPTYVSRELAYQLRDSGATILLCSEASLETGLDAAKEVGLPVTSIFAFDDGVKTFEGTGTAVDTRAGKVEHWTTLLDTPEEGRKFRWEESESILDRTITLNYSSGTTGWAKGVMISHKNYVANAAQQLYIAAQHPDHAAQRARQRELCFLPMYHAMAQALFCVNAPRRRTPVWVMPKFDFMEMLQNLQRYKITDLTLVPPILVAMAKSPATKTVDLSSIERVGSGAAPLGKEICEEFERLWPDGRVNVHQGWGMTEITCAATTGHPAYKNEGVGELLPNCEAKIVTDEEGKIEAKQGERGEVWVRGPNVMKGYWNKPEATKETITEDGWLRTGDIAVVNERNQFFIVDRKKELIKVKGLQVAPAELEAILLDHPAVQDAAVIGVVVNGEEAPRAYIVPQTKELATPQTAQDIQNWLTKRVSRAKRLDGGVHWIDAIPKNPSGKILRKLLRERAAQEGTKAKL